MNIQEEKNDAYYISYRYVYTFKKSDRVTGISKEMK